MFETPAADLVLVPIDNPDTLQTATTLHARYRSGPGNDIARSLARIGEIAALPSGVAALACRDGIPIGWLLLRLVPSGGGLDVHVASVGLAAEARGAGRGTAIMQHVEAAARQISASALTLHTHATNTAVEPFYTRLGYRQVGVDVGPSSPDLVLPPPAPVAGLVRGPYDAGRDRADALWFAGEVHLRCFDHGPTAIAGPQGLAGALDGADRYRAWVGRRSGRLCELALYRRIERDGRRAIAVDWIATGGAGIGPEGAFDLVRAIAGAEAGGGPVSVAFWRPDPPALPALIRAGYEIGRWKWAKALA